MTASRLVSGPSSPPDKKLLRSYGLARHFSFSPTVSAVGFPVLLLSVLWVPHFFQGHAILFPKASGGYFWSLRRPSQLSQPSMLSPPPSPAHPPGLL